MQNYRSPAPGAQRKQRWRYPPWHYVFALNAGMIGNLIAQLILYLVNRHWLHLVLAGVLAAATAALVWLICRIQRVRVEEDS